MLSFDYEHMIKTNFQNNATGIIVSNKGELQ